MTATALEGTFRVLSPGLRLVTMKLTGTLLASPAVSPVWAVPGRESTRRLGVSGTQVAPLVAWGVSLTTIAVWPPLIDDVTVSVAVTERVPAVLRVTLKTWTPESPAVKA